jgi:hypothetical protein
MTLTQDLIFYKTKVSHKHMVVIYHRNTPLPKVRKGLDGYNDMEGHQMNRRWWKRDHQFIRQYEFLQLLANSSFDTLDYLYPLHSPIW